jgi:hypothetical protein
LPDFSAPARQVLHQEPSFESVNGPKMTYCKDVAGPVMKIILVGLPCLKEIE